jgi:hypothetical protein
MRVNLITQSSNTPFGAKVFPVSLTIKPACGLPGDYQYLTDSSELLFMLRERTDLPEAVIKRFSASLYSAESARLLGVDLSDDVLTEIGYFIN